MQRLCVCRASSWPEFEVCHCMWVRYSSQQSRMFQGACGLISPRPVWSLQHPPLSESRWGILPLIPGEVGELLPPFSPSFVHQSTSWMWTVTTHICNARIFLRCNKELWYIDHVSLFTFWKGAYYNEDLILAHVYQDFLIFVTWTVSKLIINCRMPVTHRTSRDWMFKRCHHPVDWLWVAWPV